MSSTATASPAASSRATQTRGATLSLNDVGRTFGNHAVVSGIDLQIDSGEIVAILGPSGCGKSTLLRLIAGLDHPTSGRVLIDDDGVRPHDDRCAVAFQEPRLLPWRSLRRNVALGVGRVVPTQEAATRVDDLLGLVGLSDFAEHKPREVSGGMAQRTSLARALAREPRVLLLDEPFGALDALTRLRMQDLLIDIHRASAATVVLITHDVDEALYLADRVVVFGAADPANGSSIQSVLTLETPRPRDRADSELARLRVDLLGQLGVDRH